MRAIDADALIAYCDEKWIPLNVDAVNAQPTIEPRRGKWIYNQLRGTTRIWRCSECGWNDLAQFNFCPHCGADMRGENDG